jgi:hypothetical protein
MAMPKSCHRQISISPRGGSDPEMNTRHMATLALFSSLVIGSSIIHWPRRPDIGVRYDPPLAAADMASIPVGYAFARTAADLDRRLAEGGSSLSAFSALQRSVVVIQSLEPGIISGGFLATALAERDGDSRRPRLRELPEAYRILGLDEMAGVTEEAVTLLMHSDESLKAWKEWQSFGIDLGQMEPADPFMYIDRSIRKAHASTVGKRDAFIRQHINDFIEH